MKTMFNMDRYYSSIDKIELTDQVIELLKEMEAAYLEYIRYFEIYGPELEQKFLRVYQREELKSTNEMEQVLPLVSAYYSNNATNLELEQTIKKIYRDQILTERELHDLHKLVLKYETRRPLKIGAYRDCPVYIGYMQDGERVITAEPPAPEEVPILMEQLLEYFNDNVSNEDKMNHPFIKSAIVHVLTTIIHPYEEGNGRISRLLHHTKMWQLTQNKYNVKLHLPVFYFSNSYSFARRGYTSKVHRISLDPTTESWNSWFQYNLILMCERLPELVNSIKQIAEIEKKTGRRK